MKQIIFIVFIVFVVKSAVAQYTYSTNVGHVIITGLYNGKNLMAESHKLNLILNYKTKDFSGKLNIRTIQTGIDSLDTLNNTELPLIIQFKGTIPNDDFIARDHPQLKIKTPVKITINNIEKQVIMNAVLDHYKASSQYVCNLTGSMDLELSEFDICLDGLNDIINIQFVQLLLRRKEQ